MGYTSFSASERAFHWAEAPENRSLIPGPVDEAKVLCMKREYPLIPYFVGTLRILGLASLAGFLATLFFGFLATFFLGFLAAFFAVVFFLTAVFLIAVFRLGFLTVVVAYPRDTASTRRAVAMGLASNGFARDAR